LWEYGRIYWSFFAFLEVQTTLVVEFYGVVHAMEEGQKIGLTNVWLECDSTLVCGAFTTKTNVLWMLRNRWKTGLNYCGKIRFRVTHIFHEGNACADKLANLGFIHKEFFHLYNRLPSCLFLAFFMNMYNIPMYRCC